MSKLCYEVLSRIGTVFSYLNEKNRFRRDKLKGIIGDKPDAIIFLLLYYVRVRCRNVCLLLKIMFFSNKQGIAIYY